MKKIKKLMSMLLSLVVVVSIFMTITVFAAEAEENGLVATFTFDKTEYAANEDVNVTLTVKNNNSYAVKDIQTEITLPDGITLKDGSLTQLTEEEFVLHWHDSLEGKSKRIGIIVSYLNSIQEVPIDVVYHLD